MDSMIQGVSTLAILAFYGFIVIMLAAVVFAGIAEYCKWQLRK